jgi:hypothetical protein
MQEPTAETMSGLPEVQLREALYRAQRVVARNDLPDLGIIQAYYDQAVIANVNTLFRDVVRSMV